MPRRRLESTLVPRHLAILKVCQIWKLTAMFVEDQVEKCVLHKSKVTVPGNSFKQIWKIVSSIHLSNSNHLRSNWLLSSIELTSIYQSKRPSIQLTCLHCDKPACAYFVAAICRTETSQRQDSVAATMIFTCHMRWFVAEGCHHDMSQWFVTVCLSLKSVL